MGESEDTSYYGDDESIMSTPSIPYVHIENPTVEEIPVAETPIVNTTELPAGAEDGDTSPPIPWHGDGIIDLGAANGSAVSRLASYATMLAKKLKKEPGCIPPGPLAKYLANRCCGKDVQDAVVFLGGPRGSGKSTSAIWLAYQVARAMAEIQRDEWQNHFGLDNIATLDNLDTIFKTLATKEKYKVIIIDDASLALSNRNWQSKESRAWNALLTTSRTRRWCLILTSPLKSFIDKQTREMLDFSSYVFKSYHAGGFNILKANSSEISMHNRNKEYFKRLAFGGVKEDMWVSFLPPKELIEEYNRRREEAGNAVNERIVADGGKLGKEKSEKPGKQLRGEELMQSLITKHGDEIRKLAPTMNTNQLSTHLGINHQLCAKVAAYMGIEIHRGKNQYHT